MEVEEYREPYRHWIAEGILPAEMLRAARCEVPGPHWPQWVRYANELEQKRTCREWKRFSMGTASLFGLLTHPIFVGGLARMSGIALRADRSLHGGGVHVMDAGNWLNPHLDFALHPEGLERRLSLVLFLSDWKEEWGGEFQLCDPLSNPVKRVFPAFGRAVIWESSDLAYHGVGQLSADAPPRITAACYYLATARPGATRRRALFIPRRTT